MKRNIIGLILSGGVGRRMDYQNKGLVPLKNAGKNSALKSGLKAESEVEAKIETSTEIATQQPLIAHVIARISPQVDQLYISANADLERYEAFQLPIIQDCEKWRGKGPLAGIASLLDTLEDEDIVQVVSCDGPLIPEDLVSKLSAARKENESLVVYPVTEERNHYLYLQGRVKELRIVAGILDTEDLRIRALLEAVSAQSVQFPDEQTFLNCNSMQDIAKLEELMNEEL
ncbi:molybdenum cofactor guanylyltransferase [Ignatzschineria sp. LJL83]